jgi:hypothetical protein
MMLATEAAFSGDLDNLNVDAAVAALEKAGYEVHRAPEKYRERLDFPATASSKCASKATAKRMRSRT